MRATLFPVRLSYAVCVCVLCISVQILTIRAARVNSMGISYMALILCAPAGGRL